MKTIEKLRFESSLNEQHKRLTTFQLPTTLTPQDFSSDSLDPGFLSVPRSCRLLEDLSLSTICPQSPECRLVRVVGITSL